MAAERKDPMNAPLPATPMSSGAGAGSLSADTAPPDPPTPLIPETQRGARDMAPESPLWTGRTHWKHFAGWILWALLINVVVALAMWQAVAHNLFTQPNTPWWIVGGVAAASFLWLALRIGLSILSQRYRLTSQRLFIERGILSQTVDQLELVRVDDVRITKSLLNRIFGTGTVTVMTTDATDRQIQLIGVRHPEDIAEAVRTHVRASRQKSLYVENI